MKCHLALVNLFQYLWSSSKNFFLEICVTFFWRFYRTSKIKEGFLEKSSQEFSKIWSEILQKKKHLQALPLSMDSHQNIFRDFPKDSSEKIVKSQIIIVSGMPSWYFFVKLLWLLQKSLQAILWEKIDFFPLF